MNPYLLDGPALINVSGGRTSAFMLWKVLEAHGGQLPSNVLVVFANTGKEHPLTLLFVHQLSENWGVPITWVEYRRAQKRGGTKLKVVDFQSASRNGEPFETLIKQKSRVPNWQEWWCTQYLKVEPARDLMRAVTGLEPGHYDEVIGLRADEWDRRISGMARAEKDGRRVRYPLGDAGIRKADVHEFWQRENFDLMLPRGMGNCTNCFAYGVAERVDRMRFHIMDAQWWLDIEAKIGRFDRRHSMAELVKMATESPTLFGKPDREDPECGPDGCGFF